MVILDYRGFKNKRQIVSIYIDTVMPHIYNFILQFCFSDRFIQHDLKISSIRPTSGVPQGSIVVPLLYIIFTYYVLRAVSKH